MVESRPRSYQAPTRMWSEFSANLCLLKSTTQDMIPEVEIEETSYRSWHASLCGDKKQLIILAGLAPPKPH